MIEHYLVFEFGALKLLVRGGERTVFQAGRHPDSWYRGSVDHGQKRTRISRAEKRLTWLMIETDAVF
jgi:hypothetical protein